MMNRTDLEDDVRLEEDSRKIIQDPQGTGREVKAGPLAALSRRVWVLTYRLEEARERYADRRQLLREACVCVALALLRLAGVHYA